MGLWDFVFLETGGCEIFEVVIDVV